MAQLPIALQMYTVRDECAKDFLGTLERVAQIGYQGVEFAGMYDTPAADVAKALKKLGLKAAGIHCGIEALTDGLDATLNDAHTLGCPFVVCSYLPEALRKNADDWRASAKRLSEAGAQCKKQGIQLCYHNHSFEFTQFDGQYGLDIFFSAADPEAVKCELDVYWVKHGGVDPVPYIRKYGSRVALLHMKDMAPGPERAFAEVRTGILDMAGIVAEGKRIGTEWFIVEQDVCKRPSLESARISFENLARLLNA